MKNPLANLPLPEKERVNDVFRILDKLQPLNTAFI